MQTVRKPLQTAAGADNVPQGMMYMMAAVLIFSVLNILIKWCSTRYSVVEVAFFRNLFALVPAAVLIATHGGPGLLHTARLGSHVTRGLIGVAGMTLTFVSFQLLPIADAVALGFAAPLFLTALSVPLLGERVGIHRWSAVLVGFAGVVIMARPTGAMINAGTMAAIGAAMFSALAMISVRRLSRTEHPATIIFYFALTGTIVTGLALPFFWTAPDMLGMAVMATIGLVGGMAQYCVTLAFRLAPAVVVSPLNYTAIVWASVLGFAIWGEIPTLPVLAGAAIVILSGIYILYRETRRGVSVVKVAPTHSGHA